jgi:hypothetical protein
MFGAIDIGILIELQRQQGIGFQESLPFYIPEFEVPESYFTDIPTGLKWIDEKGNSGGIISYVDHPGFTALRDMLEHKGLIKTERGWSNGDYVLSEFKLNGKLFTVNEQFPCAAAMKYRIKSVDKIHDDY